MIDWSQVFYFLGSIFLILAAISSVVFLVVIVYVWRKVRQLQKSALLEVSRVSSRLQKATPFIGGFGSLMTILPIAMKVWKMSPFSGNSKRR